MGEERPLTGRIELHNWRDFTKVMKVMGAGRWIYRGHEDADWKLDSTLDRHVKELLKVHKDWSNVAFTLNLPRTEFFAISKFREMAKKYEELDSDAAALIAMQHYGVRSWGMFRRWWSFVMRTPPHSKVDAAIQMSLVGIGVPALLRSLVGRDPFGSVVFERYCGGFGKITQSHGKGLGFRALKKHEKGNFMTRRSGLFAIMSSNP